MLNLQSNGLSSIRFACTDSSGFGSTTGSSSHSQPLANKTAQSFSQTFQQLATHPASSKVATNTKLKQQSVTKDVVATSTTPRSTPATSLTSSSSGFQHWYADNAADDTYWNAQPAAVQQLREIRNPEQRQVLAEKLASEGYTIDNAIMVWGWDAGQVMAERQADGYTWVPSATQAGIQAAPGLSVAGLTSYDPSSPPSGSIIVPSGETAA